MIDAEGFAGSEIKRRRVKDAILDVLNMWALP